MIHWKWLCFVLLIPMTLMMTACGDDNCDDEVETATADWVVNFTQTKSFPSSSSYGDVCDGLCGKWSASLHVTYSQSYAPSSDPCYYEPTGNSPLTGHFSGDAYSQSSRFQTGSNGTISGTYQSRIPEIPSCTGPFSANLYLGQTTFSLVGETQVLPAHATDTMPAGYNFHAEGSWTSTNGDGGSFVLSTMQPLPDTHFTLHISNAYNNGTTTLRVSGPRIEGFGAVTKLEIIARPTMLVSLKKSTEPYTIIVLRPGVGLEDSLVYVSAAECTFGSDTPSEVQLSIDSNGIIDWAAAAPR
jgi:hypothetical protein